MNSFTRALRSLVRFLIATMSLTVVAWSQVDTGAVASLGTIGLGQSTSSLSPIRQVTVGSAFVAALRSDGTVVCWGDNTGGQCSVPPGLNNVTQIACGASHCVALKSDGTVVCWGRNLKKQCTVPAGLANVVNVTAGQDFSLAIKSDGTAIAWGDDSYYQVSGAPKIRGAVQASGGSEHALVLMGDGNLTGTGDNTYYELIIPASVINVIGIAAYNYQSAALLSDGTIKAWGNGNTNIPVSLTGATQISGPYALMPTGIVKAFLPSASVPNPPANLTNVVQISCESQFANVFGAALRSDGTVVCWGDNTYGQCNVPSGLSTTYRTASSLVHTMYLTADHKVICRGANLYGECNVPAGLANVIQIAASEGVTSPNFLPVLSAHSMALKSDGTVACWGDNTYGQSKVPPGLTSVVQISAGGHHSVALKSNGALVFWGLNTSGQCTPPAGLPAVKQVSAGSSHTVAVTVKGTVYCWGDNSYGQCNVPAGLTGVVQVSAGDLHTVALKSDGTVVFWGSNTYSQCAPPVTLTGIVQVAAGAQHTAVRKSNGNVLSWGGYLSFDPSKVTHGQDLVPAGLVAASDVSAGYYLTNAIPVVNIRLLNWLVSAGGSTTATIFLPVAPGAAGADVRLISDNPQVTVPSTVHFNPGVQTASVPVTVLASAKRATVKVTVGYQTQTESASFRVAPSVASSGVVAPTSVYGGRLVRCVGTLGKPVTGATGLKLVSDNPNLTPFFSVMTVPTGTDTFAFWCHTKTVSVSTAVHVSAMVGSATVATGIVTLLPAYTVQFSTGSIVGGNPASCTISVPFPVYSYAGATFKLSSGSACLTLPVSETIGAGTTSVTFPVSTKGVDASVVASLTATLDMDAPVTGTLTVRPATVVSLAISPATLVGDNVASLKATLNGAAGPSATKVLLSESSASGNLPLWVWVLAGKPSSTTPFSPKMVATATTVTVTGSTGLATAKATFKINPTPNHLTSVKFSPSPAFGGELLTMTATFSGASAPTGLTLVLKSSSPLANLPPSVTSTAGSTSLTYQFSPSATSVTTPITVQVEGGGTTLSGIFTLNATRFVDFYVFGPSNFLSNSHILKGGDTANGILFTAGEAPLGGMQATLTCSDPSLVTIPTSAFIPAGGSAFPFTITTKPVTSTHTVTLTAKSGSFMQQCNLILQTTEPSPATLEGIATQNQVTGGTSGEGAAYAYGSTTNGFTITLKSSDPTIATVPATLVVGKTTYPSGFQISTKAVKVAKTITITATQGTIVKTSQIIVTP